MSSRNPELVASAASNLFDEIVKTVTRTIPFEAEWSNGVGGFDYVVYGEHAPHVKPGTVVKSVAPSGRKILIIGTAIGNIAVYERVVSVSNNNVRVIDMSANSAFLTARWVERATELDTYDLRVLFGEESTGWINIGAIIKNISEASERFKKK